MTTWVFPGQGTQRKGMGAELFDRYPQQCEVADRVVGYSVRALCLTDPDDRLNRTEHLQPALFVVNALGYLARGAEAPPPRYLAGHSLGEFNALWAAGCFDFETGVRLVARRGELMAAAPRGRMAAVIGMDAGQVAETLARIRATEVDIANHNSASQVVLAGPAAALDEALASFTTVPGVRCARLNVETAFHSRYMADAATAFADYLRDVEFAAPRIPVISNVTGLPYPAHGIGELLARQLCSPVRWRASMRFLLAQGERDLVEIGPSRVLTGLWREAVREAETAAPVTPVTAVPAAPATSTGSPAAMVPATPAPDRDEPAQRLGSAEFRRDFGIRYAYLAGSMFRGIASVALVERLGRNGLMGFFGAGGLKLTEIDDAIRTLRNALGPAGRFGVNLLYPHDEPELEQATVDLLLRHDVRFVEAAAYTQITAPLVQLRFAGAHRDAQGTPAAVRRVVAKVSRPETAAAFLRPPPASIVAHLVARGALTPAEGEVAGLLPVSEDVCVEADSGGHTDGGVALSIVPSIARLRDEVAARHNYPRRIRVGAAGGLGAPEAVAAAFVLGADFVLTGSVNQCSPEAGTSDVVKDLLATLDVQDTTYAPAGDLFELGARVQVVRKGTLFAARANKLQQVYRSHAGLDEIDPRLRATIEETYFRRSFDEVWAQTREYHLRTGGGVELAKAEHSAKHRMALVFRWYFARSAALALEGQAAERVNFQIHCGPAMGAFNRFVAGTRLADWRNRHVDAIAEALLRGAAEQLRNVQK